MAMLEKYDSCIPKRPFDSDYVSYIIEFLREKGIVTEKELANIISAFQEKFTIYIDYFLDEMGIPTFFSETELETIFNNFIYIVSYYMYENIHDVFTCRAYLEDFSRKNFDDAVSFYKSKVRYMEETLKEIEKQCDIPLIRLKYYLDKMISGVKLFELYSVFTNGISNIADISLDDGQLQMYDIRNIPSDFISFQLVNREVGIYGNVLAVNKIKAQFELFSKLDSKRISEVYLGLAYDYLPNGKNCTYSKLLTPVLLQLLFCNEYSEESISLLKLGRADFDIILVESAKNLFHEDDVTEKFYVVQGSVTKLIKEVESKLKELDYEVNSIYDITSFVARFTKNANFSDTIELRKEIADSYMNKIYAKRLTTPQREYIESLFARLTGNIDIRTKRGGIGIYQKYEQELRCNLINSKLFMELSYPTREYIKSNLPKVGKLIVDYFQHRKNCFCYID